MNVLKRNAMGVAVCSLLMSCAVFAAETGNQPMSLASPDLITEADAMRVALAAMEDCARHGQPTTVVVVDATGFQRLALSDDNAKLIGVAHSNRKAATVLAFKTSTQVLQDRLTSDRQFAEQYGKDEHYFFQGGGLPIYKDGKFVAAIAVGGSGNLNDACAQAGVKALGWAKTTPAQ